MSARACYQINYQRTDVDGRVEKGTVQYRAAHSSQAVDFTVAELKADDDTTSCVILAVREVAA